MEFMLWAALGLHIFSVVVWLGSLCFLSAVLYPVVEVERQGNSNLVDHLHRRLMPFLWLSLWTIGITGITLYIFTPDFLYVREPDLLLTPAHGKIVLFVFIIIFSMKTRRIYALYRSSTAERSGYLHKMARTIRLTILFGILSMLLAAWSSISNITS